MSILDSASSKSVYRGYDYYKDNNVISYMQISDFEYEGDVKGTNKNPYHVIINTKHPKKSSCDCPFANGNTICKHMVALFFAVSPDELRDYEDWSENDYEDEYGDYEEDDYYDEHDSYGNYNKYRNNFIKPIFFDEILTNFVDSLSEQETKNILIEELKKDEEYSFNNYLKEEYKRYTSNKNNIYSILDSINNNFHKLSHDYDYNYKDYTVKLLSNNEKEKISVTYNTNISIKEKIDKIFLDPELATYDNYKWIADFYKKQNKLKYIKKYIEKLESFFNTLKHYSIRNTIPKSNVLINLHILNDYTLKETAELLVKNSKYKEYVAYIIDSVNDTKNLYKFFKESMENERYINKESISNIYYKFYLKELDDEMYNEYLYYSFLNSKDIKYLISLKDTPKFDYYINKMIDKTKDVIVLEKIYLFLDKKELLFKLLYNKDNEHRLIANIELLRNEYNEELLEYLKNRFYEIIKEDKKRQIYHKASFYVGAMYKLNDGERLVNELTEELKQSEYSKRIALFDEINNAIDSNKNKYYKF